MTKKLQPAGLVVGIDEPAAPVVLDPVVFPAAPVMFDVDVIFAPAGCPIM